MTVSLFMAAALAISQPSVPRGADEPERYDVTPLVKLYPQSTPKEALESAIKAAEKGRQDYIAAFLLDPAFIDAEAAIRGKAFVAAADEDLRKRRTRERYDSNLPRDKRLPDDPVAFQTFVEKEAQARGFRRFVMDMKEQALDNPNQLKELRRFLRDGQWEETGEKAKVTVRDIKDHVVFLKKIDKRWFVENKQLEEKPAAAPANP